MSSEPLVTIIMATYNGETFIEEQLQSIIEQDYGNRELLIADDDSDDNTYSILARYAREYEWIHLYRNKKRLGLIGNFEALLERAQGDYISFCDQDDIWEKEKLSKSVERLEEEDSTQALLFHSDLAVVDKNLETIALSFLKMRSYTFKKQKQLDAMLGRCGVMGNTMIINQKLKSLVLPFPDDLKVHDYWIALINELYGKRLTSYEPLVRYRLHQTNTSNTLESIRDQGNSRIYIPRDKIKLPYLNINREKNLKTLLLRYPLDEKEKRVILDFIDYLEFKKSRLYLVILIFRYDFLRDNLLYRFKTALKILWKKR